MKKKVKPLSPRQTKFYLLHPEKFDINRLEANEMLQGDGQSIVKIPQITNRIRQDSTGKISLVVSSETDEMTGEIKEETVEMGRNISGVLPGMMLASDVYHDYFDVFGDLINDPMKDNTSSGAAAPPSPQGEGNGSDGRLNPTQAPLAPAPRVTQNDWVEVLYKAEVEHTPMFNGEIGRTHRELKGEKLKKRIEEELEKKNYIQIGELEFVRFPDVAKEKIRILPPNEKGLCPVEYIHDRWYDTDKKQMRNRKTRIGYVIDELPGVLIPNKRYDSFFELASGIEDETLREQMMERVREFREERKQREEEERLRREEDESYKTLFGENNQRKVDAANMRLSKIVSEMRERKEKEHVDNDEDYVEYEEEIIKNESDAGPNPAEAPVAPVPQVTHGQNESDGSRPQVTHQEEEAEMSQRQSHFPGVSMEDERAAVLVKILDSISRSIANQAKKHPDALINIYKARKINDILIEIRVRYQGSGYEDLLELIEEPHEVEEDGQKYITGMTYSDAEVLLSHYVVILQHIHLDGKK